MGIDEAKKELIKIINSSDDILYIVAILTFANYYPNKKKEEK